MGGRGARRGGAYAPGGGPGGGKGRRGGGPAGRDTTRRRDRRGRDRRRRDPPGIEATPAAAGVDGRERELPSAGRAPLAQGRRLAHAVAQEVQLGPPDLAVPADLDLLALRAVGLELA